MTEDPVIHSLLEELSPRFELSRLEEYPDRAQLWFKDGHSVYKLTIERMN